MERLKDDVAHALHLLSTQRRLGLSLFIALTIGSTGTIAVFNVVNGTLLRPLPFDESDQLVVIRDVAAARGRGLPADLLDIAQRTNQSFQFLSAYSSEEVELETDGRVVRQRLACVSRDFFRLFRVQPVLGRDFTDEEALPSNEPAAIISNSFWRSRFGADSNIVGRPLGIHRSLRLRIAGVLPTDFRSPDDLGEPAQIWIIRGTDGAAPRSFALERTFARLKPDVSIAQARSELSGIATDANSTIEVIPLAHLLVSSHRGTILLFFGAALCVLLLVTVNLMGLQLASLPRIEPELSIRAALGATRWQLICLMCVKALVVGLLAGIVSLSVAFATQRLVIARLPAGFPRTLDIGFDWRVILFGLGIVLLSSLVVSIIPAIRASRPRIQSILGMASQSYSQGKEYTTFQNGLMVMQGAAALILVIAAGLLLHNFWIMTSSDLGFAPSGVQVVRLQLPSSYGAAAKQALLQGISERVANLSSIESVGISLTLPMDSVMRTSAVAADSPSVEYDRFPSDLGVVSEGYFETLGVPILSGRAFTTQDSVDLASVTVVSESVANTLWPSSSAIGKRVHIAGIVSGVFTVVGVTPDYRDHRVRIRTNGTLRDSLPIVFIPLSIVLNENHQAVETLMLTARSSFKLTDLEQLIAGVDSNITTTSQSMNEIYLNVTSRQRFQAALVTAFGALAWFVAALGMHTVVARSVAAREKEIGVRMALGAERRWLFVQITARAMVPAILGVTAGVAGSIPLQHILKRYLVFIAPTDQFTYVAVTALFLAVLCMSSSLSAYRATRLDPALALRQN